MDAFKLKVVIGKGKFGLVYTAQHMATSKHVAIKFISKDIIFETKGVQRIQQVGLWHIYIYSLPTFTAHFTFTLLNIYRKLIYFKTSTIPLLFIALEFLRLVNG